MSSSKDRFHETEDPGKDKRGDGFAQILHNRARQASEEIHKLLLSFSAAMLALYFLALTANKDIALTTVQKLLCMCGVMTMGTAIFIGIIGLYCDTKRNYFWACSMQAEKKTEKETFYNQYEQWLKYQRLCRPMLFVCFSSGVLISIAYMILKILHI